MSSLCNKKSVVPVQCHRHGTTDRWGTLLRGWARHRCALSYVAATVVRSWSGFCGFHPWIFGFWVGCSGLAWWVGYRGGDSKEGRCAASPIIAYTISGSPLRAMCAMSSSLTHWGLNKMTILCAIFLNKLPDSKFQMELTNEKWCSSASYSDSCSNWKEYYWFG